MTAPGGRPWAARRSSAFESTTEPTGRADRMSRANVEVVQRFEDAFVRGDMDEVLSLLTPRHRRSRGAVAALPGDHRGHDGFLKLTDAFNSVWEIVTDLDLTFLDAGEKHVVVLVAFDVVTRPTGVPLRLSIVEVYTVATADRRSGRLLPRHRRDGRGHRRPGSCSARSGVIGAPSRLGANWGLGRAQPGGDALVLSSTTAAGRQGPAGRRRPLPEPPMSHTTQTTDHSSSGWAGRPGPVRAPSGRWRSRSTPRRSSAPAPSSSPPSSCSFRSTRPSAQTARPRPCGSSRRSRRPTASSSPRPATTADPPGSSRTRSTTSRTFANAANVPRQRAGRLHRLRPRLAGDRHHAAGAAVGDPRAARLADAVRRRDQQRRGRRRGPTCPPAAPRRPPSRRARAASAPGLERAHA